MASITQQFLVPVSTVSTRNASGTMTPFVYKNNTTKIKSQIMSLAAYASETDNRVERVVNHHFASCSFVLDFRKWSEQVIKAVVKHLDLPQQGTGSTYTDLSL